VIEPGVVVLNRNPFLHSEDRCPVAPFQSKERRLGHLVAIANKHARMTWAILAKGEAYDPDAWRQWTRTAHPLAPMTTGGTP